VYTWLAAAVNTVSKINKKAGKNCTPFSFSTLTEVLSGFFVTDDHSPGLFREPSFKDLLRIGYRSRFQGF